MNKEQWKAVYDFCEENFFERPSDLLEVLRENGTIPNNSNLKDFGDYDESGTYKGMMKFLKANII